MAYGWTLTLDDGTEVTGPRPNAFRDIPTERMQRLTVFDDGTPVSVDLNGERRPVIVRRVQRRMNLTSGEQGQPDVILGVGWRNDEDTERVLVWLTRDGGVTLTPRHIKDLE